MKDESVTSKNDREFLRKQRDHTDAVLGDLGDRISHMEKASAAQSAATQSDIRNIFSLLEALTQQVDRIVQSGKPNLVAYVMVVLALSSFMITVGGLALWPVNNRLASLEKADDRHLEELREMTRTRLTKEDGWYVLGMARENEKEVAYMRGYIRALEEGMRRP